MAAERDDRMSTPVLLYHYPLSPCCDKVRLALAEKGIAWQETMVDLASKANLAPDYLALNPKGYVPTLRWGEELLVESTAILDYIQAACPLPSLVPEAPREVAAMRLWLKHVDEVLHPAWPGLAWPIAVRPRWLDRSPDEIEAMLAALLDPARRDRQRRLLKEGFGSPDTQTSFRVLAATLDQLEKALERRAWLAGDSFSLADIALLPYVQIASFYGIEAWMLEGRPRVGDWFARCRARPSWQKGTEIHLPPERLEGIHRASAELQQFLAASAT